MKKKKLILLSALSLALAGSIGTTIAASAATEITNGLGEATTTVTYSVEDTWKVTIPESIVVGGAGGEVKAENVIIEQGKELNVTVSSENGWEVKNGDNAFKYKLKVDESDLSADNTVLTVAAGITEGDSAQLTAELDSSEDKGGKYSTGGETYEDTLTFNVSTTVAD